MNIEIFDLQEKIEYLQGIIRQFQSGVTDSQLKYVLITLFKLKILIIVFFMFNLELKN